MAGIACLVAGPSRPRGPRPWLRLRLVLSLGAWGGSGQRDWDRCLRENAGAGHDGHEGFSDNLCPGRYGAARTAAGGVQPRLQLAGASLCEKSKRADVGGVPVARPWRDLGVV